MPRRSVAPGRSCLECRRRKVACDRSFPCRRCRDFEINCKYPDTGRGTSARAPGAVENRGSSSNVLERMLRLEQEVEELKADRPGSAQRLPIPTVAATPDELLVANELRQAEFHGDITFSPNTEWISNDDWSVFVKHIDPHIEIFNITAVYQLLQHHTNEQSPTAFLVAKCMEYAVVMTLWLENLSSNYHGAHVLVKRRLHSMRHSINDDEDITILQALTLFLIHACRDPEGPDVDDLIGVAIGSARYHKLDQDSKGLEVSSRALEDRRRLWWHIYALDTQTADTHRLQPTIIDSRSQQIPRAARGNASSSIRDTRGLFSEITWELAKWSRHVLFSPRFRYANGYEDMRLADVLQFIDTLRTKLLDLASAFTGNDGHVLKTCVKHTISMWKLATHQEPTPESRMTDIGRNYLMICNWILNEMEELHDLEGGSRWLWMLGDSIELNTLEFLLEDLLRPDHKSQVVVHAARMTAKKCFARWEPYCSRRSDARWVNIVQLMEEVQGQT